MSNGVYNTREKDCKEIIATAWTADFISQLRPSNYVADAAQISKALNEKGYLNWWREYNNGRDYPRSCSRCACRILLDAFERPGFFGSSDRARSGSVTSTSISPVLKATIEFLIQHGFLERGIGRERKMTKLNDDFRKTLCSPDDGVDDDDDRGDGPGENGNNSNGLEDIETDDYNKDINTQSKTRDSLKRAAEGMQPQATTRSTKTCRLQSITTGTDYGLENFNFEPNQLQHVVTPEEESMVIVEFPIRKLTGNVMLRCYNEIKQGMSESGVDCTYLHSGDLVRQLPNRVVSPFVRTMSKVTLETVTDPNFRANDEVVDMNLLFCSRNEHFSIEFVALPACTYTNYLKLVDQKLSDEELLIQVRQLINSGYHGNGKRRPKGVPDLLTIKCISFDINMNDHWTKLFVCFPNNGLSESDYDPTLPVRCMLHLDSMDESVQYRPEQCSTAVAENILGMLNIYSSATTPVLTNEMIPVYRICCKLVICFPFMKVFKRFPSFISH